MRWLPKRFTSHRFLATCSSVPLLLDQKELHPVNLPSRVDDIIFQCERQFNRMATLKEKIGRESGHYRIALALIPIKGSRTAESTNKAISAINGIGLGESLLDARQCARAAFADNFLRSKEESGLDEDSLLPVEFPRPAPKMSNVSFANIDASRAGMFVKTYTDTWKCSSLAERWMRIGDKFFVALSVEIPEEMRTPKSLLDGVTNACGVGSDSSKLKARIKAKIDLAQRMLPHVRDAEGLFRGRPLNSLDLASSTAAKHTFQVNFPAQEIDEGHRLFGSISASRIFERMDHAQATNVPSKQFRTFTKAFPGYNEQLIRSFACAQIPNYFSKTRHLPIFERYYEILSAIESNQVTVLSAATGSGKTTQVPQFILSMFDYLRASLGTEISPPSVMVTQPRRIAAISVAQRIAAEKGEQLGSDSSVGYSVRFQSVYPIGQNAQMNGRILFCTAGILLRRLQSNPDLTDCSHLIIDEVHERDVFSDILLMLCKSILKRRPDIKIILMSATLEADKFVEYFKRDGFGVGCVKNIGGTNFPVESVYINELCTLLKEANVYPKNLLSETESYLTAEANEEMSGDVVIRSDELSHVPIDIIGESIGWLHQTKPPGAILCFLPGWDEIVAVQDYLTRKGLLSNGPPHKLVLLHSSGPQQVSDDLFIRTPEYRKIVLATNIAESSITIPDAVYVIDSGKQKTTFYDAKHRMNILETCWISQSNMKQRLGRAGRCQPGTYYSMMSKSRADNLPSQVPPELSRLNLDEVCLGVRAAGVTESCEKFLSGALDPPSSSQVRESVQELQSIQAFDERQQLTPLGRLLSSIPIHPRVSKMLVVASLFRCVGPMETMVAALGERLFRSTLLLESKMALNRFLRSIAADKHSDHLAILSVYNSWLNGDRKMLGVFSDQGLQRLHKSRCSIHSTLATNLLRDDKDGQDYNINSDSLPLLRFILTSGFYPDVAKFTRKRNIFRLAHVRNPVVLSLTSVNALPPSTSDSMVSNNEKLKAKQAENRTEMANRPFFYIYDELFDAGTKRIQKTTAIDPIWTVLFSENIRHNSYPDGVAGLVIDEWIDLKGDSNSINLLMELRQHYKNFIQYMVSKRLSGQSLSQDEQTSVDGFLSFFTRLVTKQSDINRQVV